MHRNCVEIRELHDQLPVTLAISLETLNKREIKPFWTGQHSQMLYGAAIIMEMSLSLQSFPQLQNYKQVTSCGFELLNVGT